MRVRATTTVPVRDAGPAGPPGPVRTLVLGLGNDILADDVVGLLVVRALPEDLAGSVDVRETALHGVALLDLLIGYERAILVDAVQTGRHPPGAVIALDPARLSAACAPSPHYAGLPEVLALAEALELEFPAEIAIIAVEIADAGTIGGAVTPAVRAAVPEACRRVLAILATPAAAGAGV